MASAALATTVSRAFDQQLGGKFHVAASGEFVSRGSFSVQLRVNATASDGVTEIAGAMEQMARLGSAHPMWRRVDWPNQQPPIAAELDLSDGWPTRWPTLSTRLFRPAATPHRPCRPRQRMRSCRPAHSAFFNSLWPFTAVAGRSCRQLSSTGQQQ